VNTYEINILPLLKFSKNNKDLIKKMFSEFNENNYLNFKEVLNGIVFKTFELDKKEIEYINSQF
jgi:hypothetical protein